MVQFVTWQEAKARVHDEPVLFAEVVSDAPEGQELEVHLMHPTSRGLHEAEREDTGHMPRSEVRTFIAQIAEARNVRFAAIRGAEDQWPPEWVPGTVPQ